MEQQYDGDKLVSGPRGNREWHIFFRLPNTVVIEFDVYQVVCWDGHGRPMHYATGDGFSSHPDEVFAHGFLKWDGCFQLRFNPAHYPIHFDGREGARALSRLVDALFDMGADLLEHWEGEA
jgi:hypothetical protein